MEERVFGVVLCAGCRAQARLAVCGEGDDVASPVGGVATAGDQLLGFEGVEVGDEQIWRGAGEFAKFGLSQRPSVVEKAKDFKLSRTQPVLSVGVSEPSHRLVAH